MTSIPERTRVLQCAPDSEGAVIATLVERALENASAPAILYVHGFVDYFFHDHVADFFNQAGYAFYALDLRKYGRSLLPHQHPNFCASVSEYYEEISQALEIISKAGAADITLMGHSTGGLIVSLYAAEGERRDLIKRVVLNSPFLEFNESALLLKVVVPAASALGKYSPYSTMPKGLSPLYGQSLHASEKGEWQYNLEWKPIAGFPVYLGWVRAIHTAQRRLQRGLGVHLPVLLLQSDSSGSTTVWDEKSPTSDTVLNVAHMRAYGPAIGDKVTLVEIAGGMHDLYLSSPAIRTHALEVTLQWIENQRGVKAE